MPKQIAADCNLAMEAVCVTEAAALAASLFMGCGDEKAADQAAVDAMQAALSSLTIPMRYFGTPAIRLRLVLGKFIFKFVPEVTRRSCPTLS